MLDVPLAAAMRWSIQSLRRRAQLVDVQLNGNWNAVQVAYLEVFHFVRVTW